MIKTFNRDVVRMQQYALINRVSFVLLMLFAGPAVYLRLLHIMTMMMRYVL